MVSRYSIETDPSQANSLAKRLASYGVEVLYVGVHSIGVRTNLNPRGIMQLLPVGYRLSDIREVR
jgi:hypothetical protein